MRLLPQNFAGWLSEPKFTPRCYRWTINGHRLPGYRSGFVNQRVPSVAAHSQTERDNVAHADSRLACNRKQNPWRTTRRTSATSCRHNGRRIARRCRGFEGNAPRHRRIGKAMDIPDGAGRGSRKVAEIIDSPCPTSRCCSVDHEADAAVAMRMNFYCDLDVAAQRPRDIEQVLQ
jgi:hypothetical protein